LNRTLFSRKEPSFRKGEEVRDLGLQGGVAWMRTKKVLQIFVEEMTAGRGIECAV
jgi:hypothetical protein